jgi:hypothetical protein
VEKQLDVIYMYIHPKAEDRIDLIGRREADERFEPASITDLRLEIAMQKREIEIGEADHYELSPWEGILKVSEGYYKWDILSEDYRKLNDAEVAERVKEVESTIIEKLQEAVSNQLKAENIPFDRLEVGTGWTKSKDAVEKPVIIIYFIVDGEKHEFPFLQEAIISKPLHNFAQYFVWIVKRRLS